MGALSSLLGRKVGMDTMPLIYFLKPHPDYLPKVRPFFQAVERGEIQVVTSIVTLLEVLVKPLKDQNAELVGRYRELLLDTEGISTIVVSATIAEQAAALRANHSIRTPDAIQLATAIEQKASFFLTHDFRLPNLPNLRIVTVDDL